MVPFRTIYAFLSQISKCWKYTFFGVFFCLKNCGCEIYLTSIMFVNWLYLHLFPCEYLCTSRLMVKLAFLWTQDDISSPDRSSPIVTQLLLWPEYNRLYEPWISFTGHCQHRLKEGISFLGGGGGKSGEQIFLGFLKFGSVPNYFSEVMEDIFPLKFAKENTFVRTR